MRTKIFILLLFFYVLSLQGQNKLLQQLQEDSNITWIAALETDYTFHRESYDWDSIEFKQLQLKGKNELNLLKYSVERHSKGFPGETTAWHNINHYLSLKLIELASHRKITLYKDAFCRQALSKTEAQSSVLDTIRLFSEDKEQIVPIDPEQIVAFRIQQYLVYNETEARFKSFPISLAPLIISSEKDTIKILFWIPLQQEKKLAILESQVITWALGIQRDVPLNNVKVLKAKKSYAQICQQMLDTINKRALSVYQMDYFKREYTQLIPMKEIHTTTQFDAETYEEVEIQEIILFKNRYNSIQIHNIRLYQELAWDTQNQSLLIRHAGFFPLEDQYDDNGNLLYKKTLFFRSEDRN